MSVQAAVLNLLQEFKESLGMSYLFVSHDLNVGAAPVRPCVGDARRASSKA